MGGHLELPDVHADAAQASVRPRVFSRSGLDGDEVGAVARVQMAQAAFAQEALDLRSVCLVGLVFGHRRGAPRIQAASR